MRIYILALFCVLPILASWQSMSAASVRSSQYRRQKEVKNHRAQVAATKVAKPVYRGQQKSTGPNHLGAQLATEFQFDNLSVHGRGQGVFQGVATVENEKSTATLIDYRKDYKDRISQSESEL